MVFVLDRSHAKRFCVQATLHGRLYMQRGEKTQALPAAFRCTSRARAIGKAMGRALATIEVYLPMQRLVMHGRARAYVLRTRQRRFLAGADIFCLYLRLILSPRPHLHDEKILHGVSTNACGGYFLSSRFPTRINHRQDLPHRLNYN